MSAKIPMEGNTYGRLLVLSQTGRRLTCQCSCGASVTVDRGNVVTGKTKSCGCLSKELHTKHGLTETNEYRIWASMIQRCENPKTKYYKNYGGRGIKVCARWHSFELFIADMGMRKYPDLTLERVDNNGDYCQENCKWATRHEQMKNTRHAKKYLV